MQWLYGTGHLLSIIWDPNFSVIRVVSGRWVLFELSDNIPATIGWKDDSFIENTFPETNATVIVDGNHIGFWSSDVWAGPGTIGAPVISDDFSIIHGNCGKIAVGNGTGARWRIYHTYAAPQNWGDFEIFSMYWYGSNTNKTLSIYLDSPNETNRWFMQLTEDWSGWKRIVVHVDEFHKVGSPSKNEIKTIAIGFYDDNDVAGIWYLNRVTVDVASKGIWTFVDDPNSTGLSHSFASDGRILNFTVSGKANSSTTYQYSDLPPLSASEYPYVVFRVKGTTNARWLFRVFFQDGTSYDFPYWGTPPSNWEVHLFVLSSIPQVQGKIISNKANLALMTKDGNPASVYIDFYAIRSG